MRLGTLGTLPPRYSWPMTEKNLVTWFNLQVLVKNRKDRLMAVLIQTKHKVDDSTKLSGPSPDPIIFPVRIHPYLTLAVYSDIVTTLLNDCT